MLVPLKVVEEWYKPSHPIRKSFNYLFQNPLWEKNIPKGFSVCPYFWMSILLSPMFRMFMVWPIVYLIIPFIRLIHLSKMDKVLYSKISLKGNGMRGYSEGFGFAKLIWVLFLIASVTSISGLLLVSYADMIDWCNINGVSSRCFNTIYFTTAIWIAFIVSSIVYNKVTENRLGCTEIEVFHVAMITPILYSLSFLIFYRHAFAAIWKAISLIVVAIAGIIWTCLTFVGHFFAVIGSFLGSLFSHEYLTVPLYQIVLVGIVMMVIFNYVSLIFMRKIEDHYDAKMLKEGDDYRDLWIKKTATMISKVFDYDDLNGKIDWYMNTKGYKCNKLIVAHHCERYIVEKMKKKFDEFKTIKPNSEDLKEITREIMGRCIQGKLFSEDITERILKDDSVINEVEWIKTKERKEREKKRQAEMKAQQSQTRKILRIVGVVFTDGTVTVFAVLWALICALFKNLLVFVCFLWEITKAQKKKACPYIRFKD